jgi:hypothetical protein
MKTKFEFKFKNIAGRSRTYTMDRVAYSVSQPTKDGPLYVNFVIGHRVLQLLGWQAGYDRVQISEKDGLIAIGRKCAQYKISKSTGSGMGSITISARRFDNIPKKKTLLTSVDYSITGRGKDKMIVIAKI